MTLDLPPFRHHPIGRLAAGLTTCVIAAALLAGCATAADVSGDSFTPDDTGSIDDTGISGDAGSASTRPFPHITSCEQVTDVIPSFVSGMTLVGESIADDGVLCQWSAPDDGPFASVTVSAADDIPTRDALAMQGKMLHLTPTPIDDPRLDGVSGLGIRWTTDGAADSPGYSNVYVPGVSIELHDGRHDDSGSESYAPADDTTVTVALAVLGL
ncbi:hypothetical protein QE418_003077 [Microbacterium testaceum]|uniref:hypothetical protein n=1 Tax=Microbacterium TaxID=33882 RepID=UPI0027818808|nr:MULTISPECIES: hypothetical protein [Microbacterium]MDQ1113629.1 hypothetical protein [Microbacterium testaceum]MDR6099269.1 hypothetical protein [Microbacterium sp. SORGH_AS_0454]